MKRHTGSIAGIFASFVAVTACGDGPPAETKGRVTMHATERAGGTAHDFDFWMGRWNVHNRRLRERLKGSTTWDEFEATCVARPLAGGLGNEDEYRTDFAGGFVGLAFRIFNPSTRQWSIYWADSRTGALEPPVVGSFTGGTGVFEGADTFEGRPIRVRFIWSRADTASPRWEQAFSADGGRTWETNWVMEMTRAGEAPEPFPVIEFRRYTIREGQRENFARRFEAFFPEAFRQVGAVAFGQFLERGKPDHFTWIRGFRSAQARGIANSAFYYGPLWKEHAATMNGILVDSDDVMLLEPVSPERGIPVLPSVDPVDEPRGARGVVVAEIYPVRAGETGAFAHGMEPAFAAFRAAGLREAGVLSSLEGRNTFPQHPVRTDGPWVVWLGIGEDERALARFASLPETSAAGAGLLRGKPERVVLDPLGRSRLRWLANEEERSRGPQADSATTARATTAK